MVSVISKDGISIFKIKGLHKIWAMESKIVISKARIIRAYQKQRRIYVLERLQNARNRNSWLDSRWNIL